MDIHRDGHTLTIVMLDSGVDGRINCPHDGKTFEGFDEAPPCRRQAEDGLPGDGHYRRDECALAEYFKGEIGLEALSIPSPDGLNNGSIDVTTSPVPIEWWTEQQDGLFISPIPPEEIAPDGQPVTEDTSDGFHTFRELYEYRLLYNAALFNAWAQRGGYDVHKSRRHSDGEPCFGGDWFIVVAQLPTGQISNHYRDDEWNLFHVEERERPAEYDGHTPADVAQRLRAHLMGGPE